MSSIFIPADVKAFRIAAGMKIDGIIGLVTGDVLMAMTANMSITR